MFKYKKTQSESSLEAKAIKLAKEHEWLTYKFTSSERGVPDRIFIKNGITVFVEFKKKGEKLRELQKHQQKRIRDKDVPALYFDKLVDIYEFLARSNFICCFCEKYIDSNNRAVGNYIMVTKNPDKMLMCHDMCVKCSENMYKTGDSSKEGVFSISPPDYEQEMYQN